MTEREYMLKQDFGNWLFYAESKLKLPESKAAVMWYNENHTGKKLFCRSLGMNDNKPGTRMFLENTANLYKPDINIKSWWNTFTLCRDKVKQGLYLAEVVRYRLDKNDNLICEVKVIKMITDEMFDTLFIGGSYKNSVTWLMLTASEAFIKEYAFSVGLLKRAPNFKELKKHFPNFEGLTQTEIANKVLNMYISGKMSTKDDVIAMKTCLERPSEFEELSIDIARALHIGKVHEFYGEKYPLFAQKVGHNVNTVGIGYIDELTVREYLNRQLDYYKELVNTEEIQPVGDDILDKVEAVLNYRNQLKEAEKAKRKEQRKMKKAAQKA